MSGDAARRSACATLNDSFLSGVPAHALALAITLHSHLARHHAAISQHGVALQSLVLPDGVHQVAMMQIQHFAAGLLMHDFLAAAFGTNLLKRFMVVALPV